MSPIEVGEVAVFAVVLVALLAIYSVEGWTLRLARRLLSPKVAPPPGGPPPRQTPIAPGDRWTMGGFLWESLYNHKILALVLIILLAIVYGQFAKSYGIPSLFWHEYIIPQLIAGVSVSLLIGLIFYVVFILDDDLKEEWGGWIGRATDAGPVRRLWFYLGTMAAPFLLLAALPAFLPLFRPEIDQGSRAVLLGAIAWPWLLGLGGGALLVAHVARYRLFSRIHYRFRGARGRATESLAEFLASRTSTGYADPLNLLLIFAAILGTAFVIDNLLGIAQEQPWIWGLAYGTSACFLVYIVLEILVHPHALPRFLTEPVPDDRDASRQLRRETAGDLRYILRRLLLVFLCLTLVVSTLRLYLRRPIVITDVFTAAFLICVGLGLVGVFYAFLSSRNRIFQIGLAVILAGALLANGWNPTKRYVPGLESYYPPRPVLKWLGRERTFTASRLVDLERPPAPNPRLLANRTVLESWEKTARSRGRLPAQEKPKLAIVTVSGGAIRSATWTAVVLSALERELNRGPLRRFPEQLRLITGASGGMLGAAYYTTTLSRRYPELNRAELFEVSERIAREKGRGAGGRAGHPGPTQLGQVAEVAGRHAQIRTAGRLAEIELINDLSYGKDFLSPVVGRMVLRDLPWLFCPSRQTWDRGRTLEQEWEKSTYHRLEIPFVTLGAEEAAGEIPSLVFSPLLVEDGRRLLISNLDLRGFTGSQGSLIAETGLQAPALYSTPAVQFFDLFPEATRFTVATAVRLNATFPYVSPATSLPTKPVRRVMDAGIYDNYGVNLACAWILEHADWLAERTSGVVLIQVRAFANEEGLRKLERSAVTAPASDESSLIARLAGAFRRGPQFLTAPLEAVSSVRVARNYFLNDGQVEVVHLWFHQQLGKPEEFFTTVIFSCANGLTTPAPADAGGVPPAEAGARQAAARLQEERREQAQQHMEETLTWTITASERRSIIDAMEKNQTNLKRLEHLVQWWDKDHSVQATP